MVIWIEKNLHLKAVRLLCKLILRKALLLCGDVEKNPGPFDKSNLSTFDKVLVPSQKRLKFFLINSRSIQNKYEDLSNLLEQLDSQTILIVTETEWVSEQQDTNFYISNEHFFNKKLDRNKRESSEVGVLEFEFPDTSMLNVRKNLRWLMQIFLNQCGSKIMNL